MRTIDELDFLSKDKKTELEEKVREFNHSEEIKKEVIVDNYKAHLDRKKTMLQLEKY